MLGRLDLGMTVTSISGTGVGGGVEVEVGDGFNRGTETEQPVTRAITKRSESVFQICFIVLFSHARFIIGLILILSALQNGNADLIHSD